MFKKTEKLFHKRREDSKQLNLPFSTWGNLFVEIYFSAENKTHMTKIFVKVSFPQNLMSTRWGDECIDIIESRMIESEQIL